MSGRALYLTWRPRSFDDVVGQHHVVRTIRNAVRHGTIAHAYLFSGPRGTGKTSMARLLFKAVNCLNSQDGAPCERCAICTSANEGRALDLVEMDAASNRGIDDVRELRDKINYAPADARYRVYILDEAHQLTQAAWDALLKTLEEPPPHAILVLATTEAHKVPPTVLSRCQRFDFHRHTAADIRDRLARIAHDEGIDVEPVVLSWLARAARGGMRDAISLLDQLRSFSGDRIDADSARDVLGLAGLETVRPFLEALRDELPGDALEALNGSLDHGADLRVYLGDSLTYLRALMLLRYGAASTLRAELPDEELGWLEEQVTAWEAGRLRELVGGFGDALARFRDPAQLLIQVELVVLGGAGAPEAPGLPAPTRRTAEPPAAAAPPVSFTPARAARQAPTSGPHPPSPPLPQARPPADLPPPDLDDAWPPEDFASPWDEDQAPAAPTPPAPASTEPPTPAQPVASETTQPAAKPGSRWDGLGVGGTTVRAHWENDDDDDEVVRVVVEAPPPPPPPPPARAPVAAAASNGHAPTLAVESPTPPTQSALDFEDLSHRWSTIRSDLCSGRLDRTLILQTSELAGIEGDVLVIRVGRGHVNLLKDDKRRELRGDLIKTLERPNVDFRFIDEAAEYRPPVAAASSPAAAVAAPALPTSDPVIQAGLRYFGGPLERLPDE